jgi:hypothetical protein
MRTLENGGMSNSKLNSLGRFQFLQMKGSKRPLRFFFWKNDSQNSLIRKTQDCYELVTSTDKEIIQVIKYTFSVKDFFWTYDSQKHMDRKNKVLDLLQMEKHKKTT